MKQTSIKTKDKDEFLKSEYNFFKAVYENDYAWFVESQGNDVKACPHCGILYWKGCNKRCECEFLEE